MTKSNITFRVRSTGPDLHLHVILDGKEMLRLETGSEPQSVIVEFDDGVEKEHLLELVMSGKQPDHTRIDESGAILEDRVIEITDVAVDDIELGYVFVTSTRYHHDFNGTGEPIDQEFHGVMGCNGTVKFPFNTPIYLWLLENM